MAVGFFVEPMYYRVGTGSFLNAFFSTVAVRLEGGRWGSKYPCIMRRLYDGQLAHKDLKKAKKEVHKIKAGLEKLPPTDVVWDYEDRALQPPWGSDIAPTITSLGNYFVTSDGKDFFEILIKALDAALETGRDVVIRSL